MDVLASVIIVAYNSRKDLETCLDALLPTLPANCEVILWDNNSADGSASLVQYTYPQVYLLCSPVNLGFAIGNNRAASYAKGEFLIFLNPDTRVEPGWLEALLSPFNSDPSVGMVTPKILLMQSQNQINTCGNDIHLSGLTLCRGSGLSRDSFTDFSEVSAVSGAAFAMRRELFERIGGFDENFFLYVEDSDLSLRARLAGYRILYVPGSIVHHQYTLHFGPRKTFFQERNRSLMLLKNLHFASLVTLLPALLLGEIVTWGFILLRKREQWKQKIEAYIWIIRCWSQVYDLHIQTQSLRARRDRDLLYQHKWRLAFEQASSGFEVILAHIFFDPLFFALKGITRLVIWW